MFKKQVRMRMKHILPTNHHTNTTNMGGRTEGPRVGLHMANGPEPELAKHAPRTSGHTSLKQEHQSTSIYTQESESPQLDSKPRVNNPSNCVFLSISLFRTAEIVSRRF